MRKLKRQIKYWLPPILWACVIFMSSSRSVPGASEIHWQDFVVKKTAHVVVYAILSLLMYRGFLNNGYGKKKAGYLAILISVLYGATDEFHQSFTSGRQPTLRDVFFDTIGAVFIIYSIWNWLHKMPKKLKLWAKRLDLD